MLVKLDRSSPAMKITDLWNHYLDHRWLLQSFTIQLLKNRAIFKDRTLVGIPVLFVLRWEPEPASKRHFCTGFPKRSKETLMLYLCLVGCVVVDVDVVVIKGKVNFHRWSWIYSQVSPKNVRLLFSENIVCPAFFFESFLKELSSYVELGRGGNGDVEISHTCCPDGGFQNLT